MTSITPTNTDASARTVREARPDGHSTAPSLSTSVLPGYESQLTRTEEHAKAFEQTVQQAVFTGKGSIINEMA